MTDQNKETGRTVMNINTINITVNNNTYPELEEEQNIQEQRPVEEADRPFQDKLQQALENTFGSGNVKTTSVLPPQKEKLTFTKFREFLEEQKTIALQKKAQDNLSVYEEIYRKNTVENIERIIEQVDALLSLGKDWNERKSNPGK